MNSHSQQIFITSVNVNRHTVMNTFQVKHFQFLEPPHNTTSQCLFPSLTRPSLRVRTAQKTNNGILIPITNLSRLPSPQVRPVTLSNPTSSLIPPPSDPHPETITLLIGRFESAFHVPAHIIHLSPLLTQTCCGTDHDPEEPYIIRLPTENALLFSDVLGCFYHKDLVVRIDMTMQPWNVFTPPTAAAAAAANGEEPPDDSLRRTHIACNHLAQVYSLGLKYQFAEVQTLALKKLALYIDPGIYPDGFLWQVSMVYSEVPGGAEVLRPYLERCIRGLERRGEEGRGWLSGIVANGGDFGWVLWRECERVEGAAGRGEWDDGESGGSGGDGMVVVKRCVR